MTYTTRCTGVGCVGRKWAGQLLRCPSCGSSLVLYAKVAVPAATVAVAV